MGEASDKSRNDWSEAYDATDEDEALGSPGQH